MKETRFKDTEIGRIPEEWEVVSLLDRGTLQKNSVNPQLNKEKLFVEYSMPSFDEGKQPIAKKGKEMQSNRTCISSPVLLFNKLNVRQHRIWYINSCPSNAVCSTEFLPYSSKDINLELLQYIVGTKKVTEDFIGMSRGTSNSQKRIAPSDFLEYKIALPSSATEQSRIASALTNIDNLISSIDKLIGKKKNIKQATMQQLLNGRKCLKGFTEPWVERKLIDSFSVIGNNTYSRDELSDSGTIRNIHYGDVLIKYGSVIDAASAELPFIRGKETVSHPLMDGDIIMADTAEDETCGKVCEIRGVENLSIEAGLHTIVLRPNIPYGPCFLGYYMNSSAFHDLLLPLMQGTKVTSISKTALMNVQMMIPSSITEQSEIAKVLVSIDNDITALESKKAKYESIKQGMMQQLLTGKIRLK